MTTVIERSKERLGFSDEQFETLKSAYDTEQRHYHNLDHISFMLIRFEKYVQPHVSPEDARFIELGIWFHDVVYDSHAKDNEERSADYAEDFLKLSKSEAQTLRAMILATRDHVAETEASRYLNDLDLFILSAADSRYVVYAEAIRKEYHWVSNGDYALRRIAFLERLLEREELCSLLSEKIHGNPQAARSQAHGNLRGEIERLKATLPR